MSQDNDGWYYPKGAPEVEPEEVRQSAIHGGSSAFQFDSIDGQVHVRQVESHSAASVGPTGYSTKGILATARTMFGSPTTELKPETLVEVAPGAITSLAAAEAAGYVKRDQAGNYIEVNQAPPQQATKESPDDPHKAELFDAPVEAELAELVKDAPAPIIAQMMVQAALAVADTGVVSVNPEEVSSRTGMSVEQATQFIAKVEPALRSQADAELKKADVDPAEFLEWAMQHRKAQLQEALVSHVNMRSLSGYRSLAEDYRRSVVPSADSLEQAGYKVRIESGKTSVKVGETWYEATVAARLGLI